jgi:hypothetical protein
MARDYAISAMLPACIGRPGRVFVAYFGLPLPFGLSLSPALPASCEASMSIEGDHSNPCNMVAFKAWLISLFGPRQDIPPFREDCLAGILPRRALLSMFMLCTFALIYGPVFAKGETWREIPRERKKFEDYVAKSKYMCCRCGAAEVELALTPDLERLEHLEKEDLLFETVSGSGDDAV